MTELFLREEFQQSWKGSDPFERVRSIDGEIFRDKEGRRTLRFVHEGLSLIHI